MLVKYEDMSMYPLEIAQQVRNHFRGAANIGAILAIRERISVLTNKIKPVATNKTKTKNKKKKYEDMSMYPLEIAQQVRNHLRGAANIGAQCTRKDFSFDKQKKIGCNKQNKTKKQKKKKQKKIGLKKRFIRPKRGNRQKR
jgi:hypothetical protein